MVGDDIRKARVAAGLTQERLAAAAKVSREHLSEIERGRKSPKLDTLIRLCRALSISAADVVARIERESRSRGR